MPTIKETTNKKGERVFKISVYKDAKTRFNTTWKAPPGWSNKTIQREVNKFAAQFEQECNSGLVLTRSEQKAAQAVEEAEKAKIKTLSQYSELVFMPAKKIECTENTRAYYQNALTKHILPKIGNVLIPDITSAEISALLLEKQAAGLSHSSVVGIYITLNQLFKMAYFADLIPRNPMDKVQRPKPQKDEKQKELSAYTIEELQEIYSALNSEPLKWQAYISLSIDTGCRRGEICGLKWHRINFEKKSIQIVENLCYTAEKGIYVDTTKTGSEREVYFSDHTAALLKALRAEQLDAIKKRAARLAKEGKPLELSKIAIPEYVFTEKGSCDPIHPQSPTRYFKKFGDKYKIKDFHPHKLRHTFASLAITNGADIASVSEILGHADKATTLRMYTHADEEAKKRTSELFQSIIKRA